MQVNFVLWIDIVMNRKLRNIGEAHHHSLGRPDLWHRTDSAVIGTAVAVLMVVVAAETTVIAVVHHVITLANVQVHLQDALLAARELKGGADKRRVNVGRPLLTYRWFALDRNSHYKLSDRN